MRIRRNKTGAGHAGMAEHSLSAGLCTHIACAVDAAAAVGARAVSARLRALCLVVIVSRAASNAVTLRHMIRLLGAVELEKETRVC